MIRRVRLNGGWYERPPPPHSHGLEADGPLPGSQTRPLLFRMTPGWDRGRVIQGPVCNRFISALHFPSRHVTQIAPKPAGKNRRATPQESGPPGPVSAPGAFRRRPRHSRSAT
jgi:hypothetical protein